GERCAAGREENWHMIACRIDNAIEGVRGTDVNMHHDHLRFTRDHVVAVCHGDGGILVWYSNWFGCLFALLGKASQAINEWGKVRAGVGEEIVDAAFTEQLQVCLRRRFHLDCLARHAHPPLSPSMPSCLRAGLGRIAAILPLRLIPSIPYFRLFLCV